MALSLGTVIAQVGLLTALLLGPAVRDGLPADAPGLTALLGARAIAGITAVQFAGMLFVAVGLAALLPTRPELAGAARSVRARIAEAFPVGRARTHQHLAAAVVLGFTAGLLPSWLVDRISDATGLQEAAEQLVGLIRDSPPLDRALVIAVVALLGPVAEELVFRGFLFAAFDRSFSRPLVVLCTAVLFAAYHLDPLQSLAVLPLGLVLGWLRSASGSLRAPIALHVVNNSLASALILFSGDEDLGVLPALAGAAVAVAAILWAEITGRRAAAGR